MKTTRVALIQMSCDPDTKLNLDKAAERVYEAARQGAKLVCLPELFRAQLMAESRVVMISPSGCSDSPKATL